VTAVTTYNSNNNNQISIG